MGADVNSSQMYFINMEVLDTGSHLKDTENQAPAGNYTCRLPKDLTIGSNTVARNRGEVDVRLLLACKTQLSSEVVRLKTDSLRLQKERDAARIRMRELDQILLKFSERTRELENRLYAAEDENKRLRARMLGLSNVSALQKLSVSLDKFHSYPWLDGQSNPLATPNSCSNTLETKKSNPPPQEDWREVSQKLLEQMKQEMKEIREMSSNFSLQDSSNHESASEVKQKSCESEACDETLEESLSHLMSETKSLKHSVLKQRKTLKSLMNDIKLGHIQLTVGEIPKDESKSFKSNDSNEDKSALSVKPKSSQYSRHSDDSFHAFFTKQLDGCQNFDKMNKAMQLFMQSNPSSDGSKTSPKVTSPKTLKSQVSTGKQNHDKKVTEEERVCPICQVSFDVSVPQEEFEGHVLDHLEAESASLLDQYVVL